MGKTKMIKVHFSGWQLGIFSLSVNLLVLAIQPQLTLAQTKTGRPNNLPAANKIGTKDLEPEILSEINRVRTNPQDYAQWLEQQRQYYDGIWLRLPGEKPVRTNKGRKALEEAIAFLKQQQPLPALEISELTAAAATSELEKFANSNNIEYFSYGRKTATGIVMDLVVDELFPDRRRRQSLLSSEAEDTGVVCKPDPRYSKVCAIAYSDSPATADMEIASSEEVSPPDESIAEAKPETSTKPEEQVAKLPEVKPPTENSNPESQPEPQVEAPKPEEAIAEVEKIEEIEETEETIATATLPVPPQPQIPNPPSVSTEEKPQPIEEEKVEIEKPEEEVDIVAEVEEEIKASEIESEIAEIAKEEEIKGKDQELEIDDETQSDEIEAEILEDDSEEVAINTETAGFSEKVERGTLEEGDRVIADDGSLYDFYPIRGKAGESFTIYLESDEFDTFVALVDSKGKTIDENDDISQEDSNSQISVTLPEDGIYNVIVNTYDENGTGEYVLTVSR